MLHESPVKRSQGTLHWMQLHVSHCCSILTCSALFGCALSCPLYAVLPYPALTVLSCPALHFSLPCASVLWVSAALPLFPVALSYTVLHSPMLLCPVLNCLVYPACPSLFCFTLPCLSLTCFAACCRLRCDAQQKNVHFALKSCIP